MARSASGLGRPAAVSAAGLLFLSAGCGGGAKSEAAAVGGSCSKANGVAPAPAFSHFPFPPGAVLTRSGRESGADVVEGYVPGRSLEEVRDDLKSRLPRAGYKLGNGDAEEHEAETAFSGFGRTGHVKIRDDVCDGAVSLGVALRSSR